MAAAACTSEVGSGTGDDGAARKTARPVYGDTLIEALLGDIQGLIPNITSDSASHTIGDLIYSGLVKRDGSLRLVGDLAESWTVSRDCRNMTFQLKKNVKWHDGRPFTADDVVFTYQAMVNPKTPTAYKEDFKAVESIEAVDAHTVRVRYARPYAKALQSWSTNMLPRHLLESYVAEGRLREAPQNRESPVGTGPYRFKEWRTGEKVVLTANRDYYETGPYLSRLVYRIIPSQATIFLELKAKAIDSSSTLTALQYKRQTDYPGFRRAYQKFRYPSSAYTYFGFNLKDPRFADKRVRQAFAHAISKQELIEGVRLGLGREATGPYKPGTWVYNPNVKRYPHDLERARQLLAEAGWTEKNGDGLLAQDGKPLTFTLTPNQGTDEKKSSDRLQEILAEDQPIVFLYFPDALPVVATRVHGVVESPNGIGFNFTEWFVPRSLQRYTAG